MSTSSNHADDEVMERIEIDSSDNSDDDGTNMSFRRHCPQTIRGVKATIPWFPLQDETSPSITKHAITSTATQLSSNLSKEHAINPKTSASRLRIHTRGRFERISPKITSAVAAITLSLLTICYSLGAVAFVPPSTTTRTSLHSSSLSHPVTAKKRKSATSSALFGIKGFRQWFEEQFPNAVQRVDVSKHHETFDHVLIDMNTILHVVIRRSRDEEHAVILLMRELDTLIQRVKPSRSLVLAIDGSPAAAKLSTQRKRRFGILKNSNFKLQNLDKMRVSKRKRAKRLRSYQSDLKALELTPGTERMQSMEAALLYWAWQRLQSQGRPHSKLVPRVRIYLSSSRVPGEGEIKLLEWVHNFRGSLSRHPSQTIALIGGDADLLLEAMVLPPAWTHNVFVLRPEEVPQGNRKNDYQSKGSGGNASVKSAKQLRRESKNIMLCTSLWEMTLNLDEFCRSTLPAKYYHPERDQKLLLQIRNDLVLLMIMNGNDYLPRLVASGFRDLFRCYMTLLEQWIVQHGSIDEAGLIDPNTLRFRLPFCIQFFGILGENAPTDEQRNQAVKKSSRRTYQSILNNMISVGFVPGPARFHFISGRRLEEIQDLPPLRDETFDDNESNNEDQDYEDDEDIDEEEDDDDYVLGDDDDEDEEVFDANDAQDVREDGEERNGDSSGSSEFDGRLLLRLTLGKKGEEGSELYQMWSGQTSRETQKDKGKLAKQVLEKYSLLDVLDDNGGIHQKDYSWEVEVPAESNVERYLAGLVWTLQTYQDGVCPCYGYNYGKCLAPTGRGIEEFFSRAMKENKEVGAQELLNEYNFGGSITAGAACLAALPSSVKNLVPKPYSLIDSGTVEEIYAECMDPTDNFFQLQKFQSLVEKEIEKITSKGNHNSTNVRNEFIELDSEGGRRVILGDHYWSVLRRVDRRLQHPFRPPPPPAGKFHPMRFNAFIKASRIISMDWPRPRPGWENVPSDEESQSLNVASKNFFLESWLSKHNTEVDHMDFGSLIIPNVTSVTDIPYKVAFKRAQPQQQSNSQTKTPFEPLKASNLDIPESPFATSDERKCTKSDATPILYRNLEDQTSATVLKQLQDTGVIDDYVFSETQKANDAYEMTLLVRPTSSEEKPIFYRRRVRPRSGEKKKATQEILASLVLRKIIQKKLSTAKSNPSFEWYDVSFQELNHFLSTDRNSTSSNNSNGSVTASSNPTNPEMLTALQLLKQLSDIGVIETYDFEEEALAASEDNDANGTTPQESPTKLTLNLSLGPSFYYSFSETRVPGVSKQATRQYMASTALNHILNSFHQFPSNVTTQAKDHDDQERVTSASAEASIHWSDLTSFQIKNQLFIFQKS